MFTFYLKVSLVLNVILKFQTVGGIFWDNKTIHQKFPDSLINSFPSHQQNTKCISQFSSFIADLKAGKRWALGILDTWGDGPSGIYHRYCFDDYGHFDLCLSSSYQYNSSVVFDTQHVVLGVSFSNRPFRFGVCLPAVCDVEDVEVLMELIVPALGFKYHEVIRLTKQVKPFWWQERVLFLLILLLIFVGCYGTYTGSNTKWSWVSFKENLNYFFDERKVSNLGFLDGIRTLSFFQIVLYNVFNFGYSDGLSGVYNRPAYKELQLNPLYTFAFGGVFAADTYFLISGLLLSCKFFDNRRASFNLARFYCQRLLRLLPPIIMMDLVLLVLSPRIHGPGPGITDYSSYFDLTLFQPDSKLLHDVVHTANYSIALLFHLNYHLWYIIVDLQLTLIAPVLLHALWRWGYKVFPLLICMIIGSMVYYGVMLLLLVNPDDIERLCETRCGPWLIGLMLGYVLHQDNAKKRLESKALVIISSLLTIRGLYYVMSIRKPPYNDPFYTPTSHIMWALLFSWLLFLLFKGYLPTVTKFLCFPTFQSISKLSFCAYLWHVPLMIITVVMQRTPTYINGFLQLQFCIAIAGLSLLVALPWTVLFELPARRLLELRKVSSKQVCQPKRVDI